ncbi:MAG: terpene cyclase/mutase family protein, partial [Planctomycetota bacterium]|nr:terpene cyclase/mutase family protein [Planctomycetota bacterium]
PIEEVESEIDDEVKSEDPTIMDAEEADHNETPDDEPYEQAKGDSFDFISDKSQQNTGVFDTAGLGGGSGGRYGGRFGGRRKLRAGGGGGRKIVDATISGLKWLARHQNPEGYWDSDGFHSQCKGTICDGPGYPEYDVGITGLSLLAFLGAGYTHVSKEVVDGIKFGEVVKNGLLWLQKQQDAEGLFGGKSGSKYMYNHSLGTLAMCEAYGMSSSPLFEKSAKKGIEYLLRAQTKYRAWRYEYQPPDNDMSVTGWCVMALKSAELADIMVGQSGYQGALNFLNEVTEDMYFRVGYLIREDAGALVSEKGKNDQFKNHNAMTAIGMLVRMYIEDNSKDPKLDSQAKILMQDLPDWNKKEMTNDYYYWYYATLALYMYDGPDSGSSTQK